IITGLVVAIPALFMNLTEVTDLTSIGTLFAFVLVCGGVLLLPKEAETGRKGGFKMPYINGKFIIPLILLGCLIIFRTDIISLFDFSHGWDVVRERIPLFIFLLLALAIGTITYLKNLSLIPVLGLL